MTIDNRLNAIRICNIGLSRDAKVFGSFSIQVCKLPGLFEHAKLSSIQLGLLNKDQVGGSGVKNIVFWRKKLLSHTLKMQKNA